MTTWCCRKWRSLTHRYWFFFYYSICWWLWYLTLTLAGLMIGHCCWSTLPPLQVRLTWLWAGNLSIQWSYLELVQYYFEFVSFIFCVCLQHLSIWTCHTPPHKHSTHQTKHQPVSSYFLRRHQGRSRLRVDHHTSQISQLIGYRTRDTLILSLKVCGLYTGRC